MQMLFYAGDFHLNYIENISITSHYQYTNTKFLFSSDVCIKFRDNYTRINLTTQKLRFLKTE